MPEGAPAVGLARGPGCNTIHRIIYSQVIFRSLSCGTLWFLKGLLCTGLMTWNFVGSTHLAQLRDTGDDQSPSQRTAGWKMMLGTPPRWRLAVHFLPSQIGLRNREDIQAALIIDNSPGMSLARRVSCCRQEECVDSDCT